MISLDEFLQSPSEYLEHYASKYYDPQKAHEYYMEHRKLKGREKAAGEAGTSSVNPTAGSGTATTSSNSSGKSSSQSSYEEEYERYHFETQKKIAALQRRLGRLSKEARLLLADEIYAEIDKIREDNMNKKYELKAKYGKGSGGSGSGSDDTSKIAYQKKWGTGS